ncbi:MAG: UDP-N-acetylmuramoyl-tripeptide--D-alanyl-D-alanine ligase [Parcubacteria group bacterium]
MLIRNLIYILQLNLYDIGSFLKFAYTHPAWWRLEKRATITWTKKAKLVYVVTIFFLIAIIGCAYFQLGFSGLGVIFFEIIMLPAIISFATVSVYPIDKYLKGRLVKKAKLILRRYVQGVTVIGITGSYGKTSTREILASILGEKFRVFKLEENINTDIGIADYIVKNPDFLESKEVFIVEMGAYKKGDIKDLCDLVSPDYSILTGINESHLERFGSLENTIQAKFELPLATKKMAVLNFKDENVKNNFSKFDLKNSVGVTDEAAQEIKILDNFLGLEFKLNDRIFKTKLLAGHNIPLILLCLEIAGALGMDSEAMAKGVEKISYIPHRLEPIYNDKTDVWVIDDSYNGNFNGIISGLEVLGRARGRRIVLTPGLVELGKKTEKVHNNIGQLYADQGVDLVLLIKNKATKYIVSGLKERGFENYKIFDSSNQAHAALPEIIQRGDTIIFQNDLPDNYF